MFCSHGVASFPQTALYLRIAWFIPVQKQGKKAGRVDEHRITRRSNQKTGGIGGARSWEGVGLDRVRGSAL